MQTSPVNDRFGDLALPLLPMLYRHAVWLCRDPSEAEDLVQETLSKGLRGFESFQTGTNFKAWIFRVLRNSFLTSRTGWAVSRTVFLEDHPGLLESTEDGSTPEDHLIRLSNQAAVHQSLEQLQPQLREAILLCDLEELKYKEIADVLDIPIGTVMSRIARGRRALYQLLQPQFRESR
jgi:RNA polymerase sigma-70 factor (ECF subfamily)